MNPKRLTPFVSAVASSILVLLAVFVWNGLQPTSTNTSLFSLPVAHAQEIVPDLSATIMLVDEDGNPMPEVAIGQQIGFTIELTGTFDDPNVTEPSDWLIGDEDTLEVNLGPDVNGNPIMLTFDISQLTDDGDTIPNEGATPEAQLTLVDWKAVVGGTGYTYRLLYAYRVARSMDAPGVTVTWKATQMTDDDQAYLTPVMSDPLDLTVMSGLTLAADPKLVLINTEAPTATVKLKVAGPLNLDEIPNIEDRNARVMVAAAGQEAEPIPADALPTEVDVTVSMSGTYVATATLLIDEIEGEDPIYGMMPIDIVSDTFTVRMTEEPVTDVTADVLGITLDTPTAIVSGTTEMITATVMIDNADGTVIEGQTISVTLAVEDALSSFGGDDNIADLATVTGFSDDNTMAEAVVNVDLTAGSKTGTTMVMAEVTSPKSGQVYSDTQSILIIGSAEEEPVEELCALGESCQFEVTGLGTVSVTLPTGLVNLAGADRIFVVISPMLSASTSAAGLASDEASVYVVGFKFIIFLEWDSATADAADLYGCTVGSPCRRMWKGTIPPGYATGATPGDGVMIEFGYLEDLAAPAIETPGTLNLFIFVPDPSASGKRTVRIAQTGTADWRTGTPFVDETVSTQGTGGQVTTEVNVLSSETDFALLAQTNVSLYIPIIRNATTPTSPTLAIAR